MVDYWQVPSATPPNGTTSNFVNPKSIGNQQTITNIVCCIIMVIVVFLRIYTRAFIVKSVGYDDWAMIISLVICLTSIALYQVLVHVGMGRHLWDVPLALYSPTFLKLYLVASVFYSSSMLSIKIAIMLLYRRLFPIQNFKWRWWAVFLFALGYSIAGILTEIFDCTPVSYQWDIFEKGKCINRPAFYIANAVCNSVSDFMILALPIPIVWDLNLPLRKKITLSFVFVMGSAGCIVSIIRLRSIAAYLEVGNADLTYTICNFVIWSAIETMMCVVCACVPTLRPLFDRYLRGVFGFGSTHEDSKPTGQYLRTDDINTGHSRKRTRSMPNVDIEMMNGHKSKAQITANPVDSDSDSTDQILDRDSDHLDDTRPINSTNSGIVVADETRHNHNGITVSHSYVVQSSSHL